MDHKQLNPAQWFQNFLGPADANLATFEISARTYLF